MEISHPEPVIEPALPIVDAHHHLWFHPADDAAAMAARPGVVAPALGRLFKATPRYLLDELLADIGSGHNVVATVYNDARAMYRADGPEEMRSVGEVEFVTGVAAMSASGTFGLARVCAAIVGGTDLTIGSRIASVLEAHIAAGGGRYRGVRKSAFWDEDPAIFGPGVGRPNLLADPGFREGFARLAPLGLNFDALLLEPQLPDLIALASDFPETNIILNHAGCPVGVGRYAGKQGERFPLWRTNMEQLAKRPNVAVKLGGFGNPFGGFASLSASEPASSKQLAAEWRPYFQVCIEAFGAERCMFESNFPVDSALGSYRTIWNAFKRIAAGASEVEKRLLFSGTAMRIYRLDADICE